MNRIKNLTPPLRIKVDDEIALTGTVEDGEIVVRSRKRDGSGLGGGIEVFRLGHHHKLKAVDPEILDHVARGIATAVRDAYRVGFDDGRAFIAEAMGLGRNQRT